MLYNRLSSLYFWLLVFLCVWFVPNGLENSYLKGSGMSLNSKVFGGFKSFGDVKL